MNSCLYWLKHRNTSKEVPVFFFDAKREQFLIFLYGSFCYAGVTELEPIYLERTSE